MQKILFFTDVHSISRAQMLTGIRERMHLGNFQVIEVEYANTDRPAEAFIRLWHPAGAIVDCGHLGEPLTPSAYSSVPAVYVDPTWHHASKSLFSVCLDADQIVNSALKELLPLKPTSLAFVGDGYHSAWSEVAHRIFVQQAERIGRPIFAYCKPWSVRDLLGFQQDLADWLASLPKPCGILAANDRTAEQVALACQLADIVCPSEVAILGVDNDQLRCENSMPSLSSIEPDFRAAGDLAAEALLKMIEKPSLKPKIVHYGSHQLVRRGSTRPLHSADRDILNALELIRREACRGLSPAQVLRAVSGSRRSVETRFRAVVGRSIGEEIAEIRFTRVFELLRDPTCPIGSIADKVGWASDSFLKRAFRQRTGLCMRTWRQTNVNREFEA